MGCIYIVTNNVNGKVYIGQTTWDAAARWKGHCYAASHGSTRPLACAIRKYTPAAFDILPLIQCEKAQLDFLEVFAIALVRRLWVGKVYNANGGGAAYLPVRRRLRSQNLALMDAEMHAFGVRERARLAQITLRRAQAEQARIAKKDRRPLWLRRLCPLEQAKIDTKSKF